MDDPEQYDQIFTPVACDHCYTPTTEIGFDFMLGDDSYSTFYATGDSKLTLGASAATQGTAGTYSSDYANPLNNSSFSPKVVAVGVDGYIPSSGYVRTQLYGEAPYRVRVVEYKMQTYSQRNNNSDDATFTFQIQLFETTNMIRIVYGPTPKAWPNVAYQIGLRAANGNVWYVNASDEILYAANGSTVNRSASTWPGSYKCYTFTRGCRMAGGVVVDNVTTTEARISWPTSGAATEYLIEWGTGDFGDAGNIRQTFSSSPQTLTGLTPGTKYNVYVSAACSCNEYMPNDTVHVNVVTQNCENWEIEKYSVAKGTDEAAWFDMSDPTEYCQIFTYGSGNCDHCYTATNEIGFSFLLDNTTYTTFYATGDAKLTLGTSAVTQGNASTYSTDYANPLNVAAFSPKIIAFGRDGGFRPTGYIRTQLYGEAPNRVRVVEYRMNSWGQIGNENASCIFQIQLFETSNKVRIVYGPQASVAPNEGYQIGLRGTNGNVWYVDASDNLLYAANGTTVNRSAGWPGDYKWYVFAPGCQMFGGAYVNGITGRQATVTFPEVPAATGYWVEWGTGECGSAGNVKQLVASSPFTMTNLDYSTDYYVYVSAVCSCGDYKPNDTIQTSFTSDCAPVATASLPWTENFDALGSDEDKYAVSGVETPSDYEGSNHYLPSCWLFPYMNTANTESFPQAYLTGDASLVVSGKALVLRSDNTSATATQSALAVFPKFVRPLDGLRIWFSYRNNSSYASTNLQLGYITGDIDAPTFYQIGSNYALTETFTQVRVDLSRIGMSFPADARLAFRLPSTTSSNTDYYAIIDNIKIDTALACADVENLAVANISTGSVTLTWDAVAGAQRYAVRTIADGLEMIPGNCRFDTVNTGRIVLSDLTGGTLYHFYVKTICDATKISDSVHITATPYCGNKALPYFESFNGYAAGGVSVSPTTVPAGYVTTMHALPTCWHFLNLSTGSATYPQSFLVSAGTVDGATYTLGGRGNALILRNDGDASRISYATLPSFSSNLNNLYVSLYYRNNSESTPGTAQLGYMTNPDDASTFVALQTLSAAMDWTFW
ncbi:MAG: fibronectin type III domain-containing protein, partial [Bacteroidales bacterium]|nr:fibronectin type III domain-containing protein [Bacteroidales bacterium]